MEQELKEMKKRKGKEIQTRSDRSKKRRVEEENVEICGVCTEAWSDETDEEELWLDCGMCGGWFHSRWVWLGNPLEHELSNVSYICDLCK